MAKRYGLRTRAARRIAGEGKEAVTPKAEKKLLIAVVVIAALSVLVLKVAEWIHSVFFWA